MARPSIEPVTGDNIAEFSAFLHRHLNPAMSVADWQTGLRPRWPCDQANHGFLLRDGGEVVGGIGALYATRQIAGRTEKFCNITSWCVLESHRQQSMRLAMAVTSQPGYHFTDFSPTAVVGGTLRFFKFQPLDERQVLLLNLPWPAWGAARVLHRPADIEAALSGDAPADALSIYRDHAGFTWLRHLLVGQPGAWCHIVYKPRVFKRLPSAGVLHVSDPALLAKHWRRVSSFLLMRGFVSSQIEHRLFSQRPWPSAVRSGFNPKLYLSPTLQADQIDYLYSETMALDL